MPPIRQATRRYSDLASFVTEHQSTLSKGALLLPADQAGGELAPEIKLDLVLPLVGRVGPVQAQVVARLPDGGVALRLPEIPASVEAGFQKVHAALDEARAYLIATGALVPKEEVDQLWAEIDALRAELAGRPATSAALEQAPEEEPADETVEEEVEARYEEELVQDEHTEEGAAPPPEPAFDPAALDQMAPSLVGALGDASLRRALITLAMERSVGVLRTENAEGQVRLGFWRAGGPVRWNTDPPNEDEALGALLLRSGQITQEQLTAVWAEMERTGCRTGDALIATGALQAQHLPLVLMRQCEFVLMRVLQEKSGDWAFFPLDEAPFPADVPPVSVVAALVRALVGQARRVAAPQLRLALKKHQQLRFNLKPDAVLALRDLRYSREEAAVLDQLRAGDVELSSLLDRGPAPFEITAPLVWALIELGLTEVARKEARASKAPDEGAERLARLSEQLNAKKAQIARGATPFELLDLHWICGAEEVRRGAERLQRELGGAGLGELPAELAARSKEVLAAVAAAEALLSDATERRATRRRLIAPEDLERAVELLRGGAEEARAAGDAARAALAEAKASELASA